MVWHNYLLIDIGKVTPNHTELVINDILKTVIFVVLRYLSLKNWLIYCSSSYALYYCHLDISRVYQPMFVCVNCEHCDYSTIVFISCINFCFYFMTECGFAGWDKCSADSISSGRGQWIPHTGWHHTKHSQTTYNTRRWSQTTNREEALCWYSWYSLCEFESLYIHIIFYWSVRYVEYSMSYNTQAVKLIIYFWAFYFQSNKQQDRCWHTVSILHKNLRIFPIYVTYFCSLALSNVKKRWQE